MLNKAPFEAELSRVTESESASIAAHEDELLVLYHNDALYTSVAVTTKPSTVLFVVLWSATGEDTSIAGAVWSTNHPTSKPAASLFNAASFAHTHTL
jgi:hypothetical protein